MEFNEKLQLLRRAKGISQEKLAEEIGVPQQLVAKWEEGDEIPDMHSLMALSDWFNVSLDEKYFYGDEELLFQVWVNLIDNAIKFSNLKGKIDVVLKQKNQIIEVQIKDHGIGMSEEEKDRIFKRFYQIDKSHSERGSGLGLAIAKRIVDLSGGTITVNSKENVGTTMIVSLPIEDETNRILIV